MPERLITIGDIHGCLAALNTLLDIIKPEVDDTIVTLGDYIDRGPDSRGVIDRMIELQSMCRLVPLLGNHDEVLIDIRNGKEDLFADWLLFGGNTTLMSYSTLRPDAIPEEHVNFLRNCRLYYETDRYIFLHGTYDPALPLESQSRRTLLWDKLRPAPPGPHFSGKTVIVGHTAQRSGQILDLGYLKCIDTCCYGEGWLTAMELPSGKIWQVDKEGRMKDKL
ncbi:MAG TPA: metallophosphoesterase family protein [Thermoguttaceae bacterium]